MAAAVYAARKRLKTVFITDSFGGQSVNSTEIQNWIGFEKISGMDLAILFEKHVRAYADECVDIKSGERVEHVEKKGENFDLKTKSAVYSAKTVLVATGGLRKQLTVPGAAEFENKGVTYCASCDGPLFADQDVVVVGGGNAGFETAAQLLAYVKSVTLIHRYPEFSTADAATVESVLKHPNMRTMRESEPVEIRGDKFVEHVLIKNIKTGEITDVPATGVFVEIGMVPATDFVKELVDRDEWGRVKIDPRTQQTSQPGIWAAGDCTDGLYHQNNIAAGDAVKALEDIYLHVHSTR